MKLKSYIILLLAACVWASCSKDEDLPKGPDATPNAFLSLAVNADAKTKAVETSETTDAPRNLIHRLSVFVYVGDFCYYKDSVNKEKTIESVESIPVKGGSAIICAVANASDAQIDYLKSKDHYISEVGQSMPDFPLSDLENEKHGALTMSSEQFRMTLKVSKTNCIGYTDAEVAQKTNGVSVSSNPISLYRNVARVQLSELKLQKETDFGTAQSFKLKKVFVANVKSKSNLLSTDGKGWGATEVATLKDAEYWYGAEDALDLTVAEPLKSILGGTYKSHLGYNFDGKYASNWKDFLYHEEDMEEIGMNGIIEISAGDSKYNDALGNLPLGNFFYVYENTNEDKGAQTLLIVCGDYTYIPKGGIASITEEDRYYAIVVNEPNNSTITGNYQGVDPHKYVKRNTKYNIAMNIAGPGSVKPYDPSARAYLGAKIDVLAWNVVKMSGSVD